ncbi:MAG TPA: hypothetical protein VNL77_08670 [Roseiflexaceae bacterium]|nr:hypothetical protein [Roseiflexaceae bacterium]
MSALRRLAPIAPPTMAALAALGMLWAVRQRPLLIAPAVSIDALGAFFALATFGGLALATAAYPPGAHRTPWGAYAAALALAAGYLTSLTPAIVAAFLPLALLDARRPGLCPKEKGGAGRAGPPRTPLAAGAPWLHRALGPLALLSLAVGYGTLATRGALRYNDRTAGAALDGFAFWFVLLAAVIPLLPLAPGTGDRGPRAETGDDTPVLRPLSFVQVLRFAWLYPLARLYSLGPWNEGWSLATLLLGGGVALWGAMAALTHAGPHGAHTTLLSQLGLALAGFGLSTGAGIAAGCYGALTYLVLAAAHLPGDRGARSEERGPRTEDRGAAIDGAAGAQARSSIINRQSSIVSWLLTPAVPFSAPFVAAWMLVGAGVAGGVGLLGAAAWLVALLGATAPLLGGRHSGPPRALMVAAGVSAALGVLAPVVVLALIQPAIEQLQGGLSVHGDINIWPWVGLAAVDSTRRGVTALPSIAVAALMLVLSALVYLAGRLLGEPGPPGDDRPFDTALLRDLLPTLREEVPWLGARPRGEERGGDDR